MLSHANFFLFFYLFLCIFDVTHEILNCLMACTVSAQTLTTRCCCVRSSEGVNLSATSGYARHNPSRPPYLCPVYFHHSCLLYSPRYRPSSSTPCDDDDVTLMPVSCSDCVLKICMLSVLACCTSVWSPGTIKKHVKKGMQPRCWTKKKKKGMMGRGLCRLEGCGAFADGNQCTWSLLSQFLL